MPKKEKKSYVIVRDDGLVLYTKPVTLDEARWLLDDAYYSVESQEARARYLAEWGNVLDIANYVGRLRQLGINLPGSIYDSPALLVEAVGLRLDYPWAGPEARQTLEELLGKIEEFLSRPVEARPVDAPARYYETPNMRVEFDLKGIVQKIKPRPEWYACKEICCGDCYGVSVFKDSFWLWERDRMMARAIVVRRSASDDEVVGAVLKDEAVLWFLQKDAGYFRDIIREREEEMRHWGYEDVVGKAKAILALAALLDAGRRDEEEGEALPA